MTDKEARIEAQRELSILKERLARCRLDVMRELKEQGWRLVPEGYKVLKNTTQEERSWPEDFSHENGNYYNDCVNCGRSFIGYKRRGICKVCAND